MCGRYTIVKPERVLAKFGANKVEVDVSRPRYNVAPMQPVPALIGQGDGKTLAACQWGFVPGWARDPAIGSRMINARMETIGVKPAFRSSFRESRCLVPADGFFEWRPEGVPGNTGPGKQPVYITAGDGDVFAFAGLCSTWNNTVTGERLLSCVIITTEADSFMSPVHNRMPVILPEHSWDAWLDRRCTSEEMLQRILREPHGRQLKMTNVSRLVNSPANDDPRCIAPAD